MREVAVPLFQPHRSIIRKDNLICLILVSRVSYLPENANFEEHRFIIFHSQS